MRRTIAFATLVLMVAATPSVPAFAEDRTKPEEMNTDSGAGAQEGAVTGQTQTDTGTTASTKAEPDFADLIASIHASKDRMNTVQTMASVSSVKIVNVRDMAQGDNKAILENAVTENQSDITGLQAAVIANPALAAKLKEQTVDPSNVVAMTIEADGSVTVFVQ